MGLVASRINIASGLQPRRRAPRSHQDTASYSYSFNKNNFTNYFFMGGERFEINDPDYLFGDNLDLNFLSCTKPHRLPYKQAQQNLLLHLCNDQKTATKRSSSRVNKISSSLNRILPRYRHRQDQNTNDITNNINNSNNNMNNGNYKQDAQTQTSINSDSNNMKGSNIEPSQPIVMLINLRKETLRLVKSARNQFDSDTDSLNSSTSISVTKSDRKQKYDNDHCEGQPSTVGSTASNFGTSQFIMNENFSDDDDDEEFKDALNYSTNVSLKSQDAHLNTDGRCSNQKQSNEYTKDTKCDIKITIGDTIVTKRSASREKILNPIYNIEFTFDTEVECSIRIFYLCTKEVTPNGIIYKPQHATYKSKVYHYDKGLNQKFNQPEHTFEPYLFDEDLLMYKPLDLDGNYNSKAVFPIVIQCVALDGPTPRQSQSLIATIEKSQLDESYSIKPLKQLIFVDGVHFILQDIYGIENNPLSTLRASLSHGDKGTKHGCSRLKSSNNKHDELDGEISKKSKSNSLQVDLVNKSELNLSDTSSLASVGALSRHSKSRTSLLSCHRKAPFVGCDNTFECVICMSEGRDTMLLPCRHLCLCSSCAQSLRYQANSCPICRCPFKAALEVRSIERHSVAT